jgi:hypothetical protein
MKKLEVKSCKTNLDFDQIDFVLSDNRYFSVQFARCENQLDANYDDFVSSIYAPENDLSEEEIEELELLVENFDEVIILARKLNWRESDDI